MSKEKKLRIILSIVGISFIQGLQFSTSPVLNQIQSYYPTVNVSLVQMLITAPAFVAIVFALLSGVLVLKFSKRAMLIFAALLSGIVGLLPFAADSFALLFACRAIYGISLGLATALNTAVVAEWFEGKERVQVMGIQAASVGTGMVIVTTIGGILGSHGFRTSYLINLLGFICFALIALNLPASEKREEKGQESGKIRLNAKVFGISTVAFFEWLFLITFTTNISMHLGGSLAGSSGVSGALTGIFSAAQIVIGLLLGLVTKLTGRYTMPAAMLCFSAGAVLLVLFPASFPLLAIGSILCGFSQGIFIPTGMVGVSNAVAPIAAALAAGIFTCFQDVAQTVSPFILNAASRTIFGAVTPMHVYQIAAIGMAAAAVITAVVIGLAGSKDQKSAAA